MDNLALAIPVFLASAIVIVIAGINLAKYGDEIAERTGWGTLWVGTILVSIATSLPELVTNISAVLIGSPGLALGNIFGADMINMFTVSVVAMVFGTRFLFGAQPRDTQILVLAGVGIAILVVIIGAMGDVNLGPTSLGGVIVVVAYVGSMRLVYAAGRATPTSEEQEPGLTDSPVGTSATRAWVGFGLASLAVLAAAPLLAISADGIAEATGLAASFMGVLAVSIVTTLPEASVSFAAAYRKSYGLVLGNIYGSCAFNLFVIPIGDLFHTEGPILAEMGREHFVAAGAAIVLMAMGFLVIKSYQVGVLAWARALVPVIAAGYLGALAWVYALS